MTDCAAALTEAPRSVYGMRREGKRGRNRDRGITAYVLGSKPILGSQLIDACLKMSKGPGHYYYCSLSNVNLALNLRYLGFFNRLTIGREENKCLALPWHALLLVS